MNYWRLGTPDGDRLAKALDEGAWRSSKESELRPLQPEDRGVLFSLDKKRQGYWAVARVARGVYGVEDSAQEYMIDLEYTHVRKDLLPSSVVRALLQKARLRLNYPPLFVVQLSAPEFQVMARMTENTP